jgi:hypothetical protein
MYKTRQLILLWTRCRGGVVGSLDFSQKVRESRVGIPLPHVHVTHIAGGDGIWVCLACSAEPRTAARLYDLQEVEFGNLKEQNNGNNVLGMDARFLEL